jgi:hypothetical protein
MNKLINRIWGSIIASAKDLIMDPVEAETKGRRESLHSGTFRTASQRAILDYQTQLSLKAQHALARHALMHLMGREPTKLEVSGVIMIAGAAIKVLRMPSATVLRTLGENLDV